MKEIRRRNSFLYAPLTIIYSDFKYKPSTVNVTTLQLKLQIITAIQVTIFLGYDAV